MVLYSAELTEEATMSKNNNKKQNKTNKHTKNIGSLYKITVQIDATKAQSASLEQMQQLNSLMRTQHWMPTTDTVRKTKPRLIVKIRK